MQDSTTCCSAQLHSHCNGEHFSSSCSPNSYESNEMIINKIINEPTSGVILSEKEVIEEVNDNYITEEGKGSASGSELSEPSQQPIHNIPSRSPSVNISIHNSSNTSHTHIHMTHSNTTSNNNNNIEEEEEYDEVGVMAAAAAEISPMPDNNYYYNNNNAVTVPTTVTPSREPLSHDSSPSLQLPEEIISGVHINNCNINYNNNNNINNNNSMGVIVMDTRIMGQRAGDSAEISSDTNDRSTTTNSSHSPAAINPLRSMNPAFSLSPRTASSSGLLHVSSSMPSVTIRTDKENPPVEYNYAVGTVEGRRNFIADCLRLAEHMCERKILGELLPAMLLTAEYDDSVCAIARLLPGVIKQIRTLNKDIFINFMGLIICLCCSADHEVIRQISTSLEELIHHVNNNILETLLLPFIMSMRVSFWSSPRAVAAALLGVFASFPNIIRLSGMNVMEWFNCFIQLARDKSHFVREMAVKSIHHWVDVAENNCMNLAEMPLPLIHMCMMDEQSDAVRYTHVSELVDLANKIGKESTTKYLQQPFIEASKDYSWRVRYITAKNLGTFARLCLNAGDLLDIFIALSSDDKKETRAIAVEQLIYFDSSVVSNEILGKMCAVAAVLAKDIEPVVRESVANLLHILLSPYVVEEYTHERRQELFALLTDEEYDVARTATRNLQRVVETLATYLYPRITEEIEESEIETAAESARKRCQSYTNTTSSSSINNNNNNNNNSTIYMNISASAANTYSNSYQRLKYSNRSSSCNITSSTLNKKANKNTKRSKSMQPIDNLNKQRASAVLSDIVEHLYTARESPNWRIRESVVEAIRHFSIALSEEGFAPLTFIIRALLQDPVSLVRARAIETFGVVAFSYGPEWAAFMASDLLSKEFTFLGSHETSYTWRIVAIQCLSNILPVISGLSPMDLRRQELMQQWMRMIHNFAEDPVSNVRLSLVKSFINQWDWYKSCMHQHEAIIQCIEKLQQDKDVDVLTAVKELDVSRFRAKTEPY